MDTNDGVIVLNPTSGRQRHANTVRRLGEDAGYEVRETEEAGDAVDFARMAAEEGASTIVAAGGDGTVNEVVRGVARAAAFDRVTVGTIPIGTGNNFAENIGVRSVRDGFAALECGERRRVDLGRANGRVFVNSCVAGLTAEASANTSKEMKTRFGSFAYVINALRESATFEGIELTVTIRDGNGESLAWSGDAEIVLVGNGRRFTLRGNDQANMEDGLFDVLVVEDASRINLVEERLSERLFGREARHAVRLQAPALEISVRNRDAVSLSLDGEILRFEELSVGVDPGAMRLAVGKSYRPDPDG